jgi:Ca-activated chloride channel homolog
MNFSLAYNSYCLAHPLWLLLLLVMPIYLFIKKNKQASNVLLLNNINTLNNFSKSWRVRLRPILNILNTLAFILLVFALARPQKNNSTESAEGNGIDIMLSMDISGSMLAQDFTPNRIEAAKEVALNFVNGRPFDKIGLVIFSGESFTLCPLTTDHNILTAQIENVHSGMLQDGTAIGMGLATAVDRLRLSTSKSKVIILMTDGVSNVGLIDPETALNIALVYNIKVYTIGIGTQGMANMPVGKDMDGNWIFQKTPVEIDEKMMQNIASKTGGQYYRCTDNKALEKVYTHR